MNENIKLVISLYDGKRSARDVAEIVGIGRRYVQKIANRYNLPRLHCGAQPGENNHQFVCGRRVDLDGYVTVTAPSDHPFAKNRSGRSGKLIYEHRLVTEKKLGRYLFPQETVDHIDGLTLHNDPNNLRLFDCNGEHLKTTISGKKKNISKSGRERLSVKHLLPEDFQRIDTYSQRRKRGEIRLHQILRAVLQLGIDSPYLLGTHFHMEKIGIDWSSRSKIELALADLLQKWEEDLLL